MAGHSPVGVNDNLPPGESAVGLRAADDEFPGRVDEDFDPVPGELPERRAHHQFLQVAPDPVAPGALLVLRRAHHRGNRVRPAVLPVGHGHLRLAVRPEVRDLAAPPRPGQPRGDAVRQDDREGHEFLGLVAGEAEHHPLVAGAAGDHAARDVLGLPVDPDAHLGAVRVEAVVPAGVADLPDGVADGGLDPLRRGQVAPGHFPGDERQVGGDQRLAGDPRLRVALQVEVHQRVGDLVGHLVRVALGDGLRGEQQGVGFRRGHGGAGGGIVGGRRSGVAPERVGVGSGAGPGATMRTGNSIRPQRKRPAVFFSTGRPGGGAGHPRDGRLPACPMTVR